MKQPKQPKEPKMKHYLYNQYQSIWETFAPASNYNIIKEIIKLLPEQSYEVDDLNNIVVKIGDQTKSVPLFCCHTDTVHSKPNTKIKSIKKDIITADNGIGGDDKCGIIACLELIVHCFEKNIPSLFIFFADEETGCIGANDIDLSLFNNVNFGVEIDRRGSSDIIDNVGSNKEFLADLEKLGKKFGFSKASGIFTDLSTIHDRLMEYGMSPSFTNLSCGYYGAHTTQEYVNLNELKNTIDFCINIVEVLGSTEYITTEKKASKYTGNSLWANDYHSSNYALAELKSDYSEIGLYADEICDKCFTPINSKIEKTVYQTLDGSEVICQSCYHLLDDDSPNFSIDDTSFSGTIDYSGGY